jgi:hypothetical protein
MLEVGSMRVRRGEARPRIGEILRMRSNERLRGSTGTPANLKVPSLANFGGQFLAFGLNGPSRIVEFFYQLVIERRREVSAERWSVFALT